MSQKNFEDRKRKRDPSAEVVQINEDRFLATKNKFKQNRVLSEQHGEKLAKMSNKKLLTSMLSHK